MSRIGFEKAKSCFEYSLFFSLRKPYQFRAVDVNSIQSWIALNALLHSIISLFMRIFTSLFIGFCSLIISFLHTLARSIISPPRDHVFARPPPLERFRLFHRLRSQFTGSHGISRENPLASLLVRRTQLTSPYQFIVYVNRRNCVSQFVSILYSNINTSYLLLCRVSERIARLKNLVQLSLIVVPRCN